MHRATSFLAFLSTLVCAGVAPAQTWTNNRETPRMLDLLELDRTGEPGWPFGAEDIANDGSQLFGATEQRHDLRSAYVDTAAGRLWLRSYVSATESPPASLTGFVFVDTDANAGTGGPASGDELDPRLGDDPSPGGYEHALIAAGAESAPTLWSWSEATDRYVEVTLTPAQASHERGEDTDPLLIGPSVHGYLQVEIESNLVGVDDSCGAELFVRSLSDDDSAGDGDLDLGGKTECIVSDSNADNVPDPSVPPECDSNEDCPWNGLCIDGACVLPRGCESAQDCASNELCTVDGRCVLAGGDPCERRIDCDDLVCEDGECVACLPDGEDCGAGYVCGPDGRCVLESDTLGSAGADGGASDGNRAGGAGITLEEGEEVTGGAFRCSLDPSKRPDSAGLATLIALALFGTFRRGRRQRTKRLPTRDA